MSTKMSFSHQSAFVKTNLLKKNKFNTRYKIAADFDLFQKLLKKKKIFYHINFLVAKVISGGISDTKRFTCLFEYFQIFLSNKKLINIFFLIFDILYLILRSVFKKILSEKLYNKLLLLKYNFKN